MVAVSGGPTAVASVSREAPGKRVAGDTGAVTVILEEGVHLGKVAAQVATWLGSDPPTGWGRIQRILVARNSELEFVERLTRVAEGFVVGDPTDPVVDITAPVDLHQLHSLVCPYDDLTQAWVLADGLPRAETLAILTPDLTGAVSALHRLDYPRVLVNTMPDRPLTCAELDSPMTGSRHVSIAS
jgi:acyl-CoA reductase-like NAD-dependent aldehyde dehydrogenase